MKYFVTGATGFIGRNLVQRLLEHDGAEIHVLVREGSRGRMEELIEGWGARDRVHPVIGDLQQPKLGVEASWIAENQGALDHVFHLAAIYDMSAPDEVNETLNVGGTRQLVALVNELKPKTLHHVSSIAVAGAHKGLFREDQFDEGQKLPSAYHRTKFESERIVREQAQVPWRVYRPAIVVGDSRTGEMDKIDGPYYFFKVIQRLRDLLPQWVPLVGPEIGDTNIVPVDFVADAMDEIAHREGLDGQAFHLADAEDDGLGRRDEHVRARRECTAARGPRRQAAHRRAAQGRLLAADAAASAEGHPPVAARRPRHPGGGHHERRLPLHVRHARHRTRARGQRHRGARPRQLCRDALGLLGAQPGPRALQGPLAARCRQRPHSRDHRRVERDRRALPR